MTKTYLNKIITLALAVLLVLSCFVGVLTFASGQPPSFPAQPMGSASEIAALEGAVEANGGWNSSLQTIYDGIALGETTAGELQNAVDAINITSTSAAETVFYWYYELSKFGVGINTTTIEAALNEVTMLPNIGGLPNDYNNINVGSNTPSFLVYNRFDLYAYQWATQLGYETSKWNLTQAYAVFNGTVDEYGEPVLCVQSNGQGWGIGYGPRYYDESAETIDMYLTFYQLGISGALAQAEGWWNWVNSNLWNIDNSTGTGYYRYALTWNTFECETGGFDQIISRLYNYDPSITNVTNLFEDLETRFLSQGWNSPQWANYVVQHAVGNSEERLENTIMSWSSLLGFYGDMTSTMQSQVQSLLDGSAGPAPAWSLLLQNELYDNSTGMFRLHSDSSDSVEATADAAVLMMLLSTVPVGGSTAVPMEDCVYEDINNIIDGGVSNINIATGTVTVSVAQSGTFLSTFGTNIFQYTLNSAGVWKLNFNSDWSNIISAILLSPLPTSRLYLGLASNSPTIYASSDNFSTITPTGLVYVGYGHLETFTYSAINDYAVNQVLVDGQPVPITGSYTFSGIQESHNITVSTSPSLTSSPTSTATPSPTPTPSPTASPTPPASTSTESPTQNPTQNPTSTPTHSPTPTASSTHGSPSLPVGLPVFLGALIFVVAVLVVSLWLSQYVRNRRGIDGEKEKTVS